MSVGRVPCITIFFLFLRRKQSPLFTRVQDLRLFTGKAFQRKAWSGRDTHMAL